MQHLGLISKTLYLMVKVSLKKAHTIWPQLYNSLEFSSVQSLSPVWLFVTPWAAACQASLSNTNSWSLPKLMSIESVIPSNHLIHCHPLLLPPSIFPSIRVFSNESALWPPDVKSWLTGKDPDAGRDWGQEKGMTEDEMAGWHHRLDEHEFE